MDESRSIDRTNGAWWAWSACRELRDDKLILLLPIVVAVVIKIPCFAFAG
jgi:hypothetical protein